MRAQFRVAAAVAVSALVVGVGATPAWASEAQKSAWALAAATTAAAEAAAARTQLTTDPTPTPTPTPTPGTTGTATPSTTAVPDPVTTAPALPPIGSGTVVPDSSSVVKSASAGVSLGFSGHKISRKLATTIAALPDAVTNSIVSETSAQVLTTPFVVSAVTPDGGQVTSFPADPTIKTVKNGPDLVTSVTPGVALSVAVPAAALASVDPSTVRIVTRESATDPWVELPSYYDTTTGTVKGESDHLSQFAVIGTPFVVPAGPSIVLDPDDDLAHTTGPGGPATELPYSVALANQLATELKTLCNATVTVTRPVASPAFLSRSIRAGIAQAANPDVTLTVAFDALIGSPWGSAGDGGSKTYTRGGTADDALTTSLVTQLPSYTGRPSRASTEAGLPYPQLGSLPGAVAHLETLYLDHNYDRPVIDNGFSSIVDGVATGIGTYLNGAGFNCVDPVTGGWPTPPDTATLASWKALGFHNYETYGGDPVSYSTGNLLEALPLFDVKGTGKAALSLALNYNSQDGRESQVGTGWSFGIGARAQRFIDGSVLIVQGDGASDLYQPDGSGGYTSPVNTHSTLAEAGSGRLALTDAAGTVSVFDASNIDGIGNLISVTDLTSNGYTLAYGAPVLNVSRFTPLASITTSNGQTIAVTTDATGHITGLTEPDGRVWGLGYSAAGDMTSLTAPDGGVKSFTYDSTHELLTATDPTGVVYLINQYDSSSRIVKQWDADGNERDFEYHTATDGNGTTTYTNNLGQPTEVKWDAEHRITSLTDPAGAVQKWTYNSAGETTSHTDQNGNTTTYGYDAAGNLTRQVNPGGAVTTHTYSSTGVLTSTTDEGGPGGAARTTTYDVNAAGLVTAAHLPDGSTATLTYAPDGAVTSTTDQAGNTSDFAYDSRGNLTQVTDPLGQKTVSTYDNANRLLSTTDPSGARTTFQWDSADRLVQTVNANGAATSYTYDGNDHVITSTDALGGVTKYTWDDLFHLTSVTAPNGGVTRYTYDVEDNLTKIVDPTGATTKLSLNAEGRPTTVTDPDGNKWLSAYDATGNLLAATDPTGAVTHYVYDVNGLRTKTIDPTGAVTTTAYDQVGRPTTVTDAVGDTTSTDYMALDQAASTTDPTGASTSYRYDAVGNETTVVDRRGQTWAQAYDADGRVTSQTDPNGSTTRYSYNTTARTVTTTNALGDVSVTAYDPLGKVIAQTNPLGVVSTATYDALGRATKTVNADGAATSATYDSVGNLTSLTNPLGATTSYAYDLDAHVTSSTNPLGVVTKYAYDPAGNLSSLIQGYDPTAASPAATDVNATARYSYTATGKLASTTDANGHTTSYGYDSRGLATSTTNPLGIVSTTSYDALGRATASTDGNEATTTTSYDSRSDVTAVSYPDGMKVGYRYDSEQNPILMTDAVGTTGWTYDPAGQQLTQTDPNGVTTKTGYDAAGNATSTTVSGQRTASTFDAAGQQTSTTSPWGSLTYTYDPAGQLTAENRSNGVNTSYSYDLAGQVTNITHQTPATGTLPTSSASTVAKWDGSQFLDSSTPVCSTKNPVAGYLANRTVPGTAISGCEPTSTYLAGAELPALKSPLPAGQALSYDYTYDAAGNVTSQTQTTGTKSTLTTAYAYDDLNRLTGSATTTGTTNQYTYDQVGNRTSWATNAAPDTGKKLTVTASFDAANELTTQTESRASGATTVSDSYDGAGNRMKQTDTGATRSTTSYTYTGAGQLRTVAKGSSSTRYAYDGLGRNLTTTTKSSAGTATTFTSYTGTDAVETTTNGVASILVRDPLDQVALQSAAPGGTSSGPAWDLQDRLGSTTAQTNPSGAVTDLASYSDFGIPVYATTGFSAATGYTGVPSNPTTGLTSFHARTYDPQAATWLSSDPTGGTVTDPGSQNHYGYAGSNPTTFIDHLGYNVASPFLDGGAVASTGWQHMSADSLEREVNRNPTGAAATAAKTASAASKVTKRHKAQPATINGVCGGYLSYDQGICTTAQLKSDAANKAAQAAQDAKLALQQAKQDALLAQVIANARAKMQPWQRWLDTWVVGPTSTVNDFVAAGDPLLGSVVGGATLERAADDDISVESMVARPSTSETSVVYPPNRGFADEPVAQTLAPGTLIDRFGHDGGTFVSPAGTPWPARSLPDSSLTAPYRLLEVVNPIEVQAGTVAPWFGQPGGGIQFELPTSVHDQISIGNLRAVTQ